jgi:hypothetical protein
MAAWVNIKKSQINLTALLERLFALSEQPDISDRINEAITVHYRGAIPFEKPVNKKYRSAGPALECLGIDGSQIYPQSNHPVLLGWVTALAYQSEYGVVSSLAKCVTKELLDMEEEMHRDFVDLSRSVLEITMACKIILETNNIPKVILMDGRLLPWIPSSHHSQPHFKEDLSQYYRELRSCYPGYLAGVIQNPRSRALLRLLDLLETPKDKKDETIQQGLFDRDLAFFMLEPGERTAVFLNVAASKNDMAENMICTYFFYTRIKNEILRVEIPQWAAQDEKRVSQVHASIVRDSQDLGMPYTLAQAHQHVVVKWDMVEAVMNEANSAYFNAGGHLNYQSVKPLIKKY